MEKIAYAGWPNCIRLSNQEVELVITTDVGPRVIRLGFKGGQNLFKEFEDQLGKTGGDEWRCFGGHRLWHAPEVDPRTYAPDNDPITYRWDENTLSLIQPMEKTTGIQKRILITLDANENHVRIVHRLINRNAWDIEAAPWALSVMAPGGRAVLPQEPYKPHPEYLLPARPLVLWHYTDMTDPRYTFGTRYIQIRQDPKATTKQKIGLRNSLGWAAYELKGEVFIKRYALDAEAQYPDFGCNTEIYTDPNILEVETLGPLTRLKANEGKVEHVEDWYLFKAKIGEDDESLDKTLLPLVKQTEPPSKERE